jgi:hypothetical protein
MLSAENSLEVGMRWRSSLVGLSWLVVLAVASPVPGAWAQDVPDIFVTPIANSPFSAVVNVERSVVLRNGSVVEFKTLREIGRDSRGRIHNESRMQVPASSTETPKILSIHLYDPQTRISTTMNPGEKTFRTKTVNHPPSTVPPAIRFSSPAGEGLPQNEFTKEEDLGVHDMEGVQARGVRQTQIIPAESSGTGKEVVITDEHWYSEDLRINLMIKHSDPRSETVTVRVAQVTRTEPDPAWFEVPQGYKSRAGARETNQ